MNSELDKLIDERNAMRDRLVMEFSKKVFEIDCIMSKWLNGRYVIECGDKSLFITENQICKEDHDQSIRKIKQELDNIPDMNETITIDPFDNWRV